MTFSLVARCAHTGMFGTAIASSSPAVAARCSFARAGVGAVSSQNITDPALGPRCLDLLAGGRGAAETLTTVQGQAQFLEYRQLLLVDRTGATAIHSGSHSLGIWAQAEGQDVAAGGNLLAHESVPAAMVHAYESTSGHIGERLISALHAGLHAGGEAGPVHSAGLTIVDQVAWPICDLRCDWTDACPIDAVAVAWAVYQPQMAAYVQRALDPREAPSYGVPGDI